MAQNHQTTLSRLYDDVWNGTYPDTADELVHNEYVIHDRELAEGLQGPELYKMLAEETRAIFPDMEFLIEDWITSGNKVALRWVMTGTHEGNLSGVTPTGKEVQLKAIEINHFENGQLIETWTQSDQLGLMAQIDALPTNSD